MANNWSSRCFELPSWQQLENERFTRKMAESCFILRPILDDNTQKQQIFTLRCLHRDINCSKNTNFVRASRKIRKTDFDRIQKTETWIPLSDFCKIFVPGDLSSFQGNYPTNNSILRHISNRPYDVRCRLSRFHWGERNWASSSSILHKPPYYLSHHFT